jgi:hypothetical protein
VKKNFDLLIQINVRISRKLYPVVRH